MEAQLVLDPTLLLETEDYIRLFEESNTPKSDGDLLCYILDESEEKSRIIDKIARRRHLKPFRVNATAVYKYDLPVEERVQPFGWLSKQPTACHKAVCSMSAFLTACVSERCLTRSSPCKV